MAWTGLGCLIQCINSIIWNKNMVNRLPVYCDIGELFDALSREHSLTIRDPTVTHIQIGLNVAIPACSLCINRRLFKITRSKVVTVTATEKRRAVFVDLLIGIGIPILQMIAREFRSVVLSQSVVNTYSMQSTLYRRIGTTYMRILAPSILMPLYRRLLSSSSHGLWRSVAYLLSTVVSALDPLSAFCGSSSLIPVMTIYTLVKRERQFSSILSSNRNLNRNRYIRLMALSSIEILGTIPIGTYVLVLNAKSHVKPWKSWAQTHNAHHYSHVYQVPASFWQNEPTYKNSLEMFRWLLVACALIFFAFFGFADEARQHYRLAYKSLAGRIGFSTSSSTLHGSSHAYVIPCARFDSMGLYYFQYFVVALHEKQGWRQGLCGHIIWKQTRFVRLIRRPTFNPIHFCRQ